MNEVQEILLPDITILRGETLQYLFTTLFILGFIAFLVFVVRMILSIRKGNRLPIRYIFLTTASFAIASIGLYGMLNFIFELYSV